MAAEFPFSTLLSETEELITPTEVQRISPPSPLEFYRQYVATNKPVIVTGGIDDWPAVRLWSNRYLREKMKGLEVTIDVTPDGLGDVVKGDYFVTPHETKMLFEDFLDILEKKTEAKGVYYCQHQNGSFTTQFPALHKDLKALPFAVQAFSGPPDAINFWMGDARAISSLHHDPYENIYAVLAGEKHFLLYPPTALYWLNQREYKKARYVLKKDSVNGSFDFEIVPDPSGSKVPWFDLERSEPDKGLEDQKGRIRPLRVVLKKGEVLFLPALWYHRVSQVPDSEGRTIAVNFWYDMVFDLRYVYFKFMESVITYKRSVDSGSLGSKERKKKKKKKKKHIKL